MRSKRDVYKRQIPASVTKLGKNVFTNCINLKSFNVNKDNKKFKSEDGVLYSNDMKKLISYPVSKPDKE